MAPTITSKLSERVSRSFGAGTPAGDSGTRVRDGAGPPQSSGGLDYLDRPAPPMGYVPGLDGVRAIAVLGVLLYHAGATWFPGGFLGVDVFFVLSGFLISTLLLQEIELNGRVNFKQFYLRRARRLLPALVVTLALSAVLVLFLARDGAAQFRQDALNSIFYVTNWGYIFGDMSYFQVMGRPPVLQHLWSLAVEEQFYLLWPIALVFLFRWRGRIGVARVALYVALASTLLMAMLSILWNVPGGGDASRLYFGTDTHCMGLLLGAAMAAVWRPGAVPKKLAPKPRAALTAIGLAAVVVVVLCFAFMTEGGNGLYRGGFVVISVASAVMIGLVCHPAIPLGAMLAVAPMRYLGTRSYGLYLYHWPIFAVTRPGLDIPLEGIPAFVLRMGLTLAAAELSYRYIEMPVRHGALRRTWNRWIDMGWPASGKRFGTVFGGGLAVLIAVVFALSVIPAPSAKDYLGGVTEVGTGNLAAQPGAGQPGSAPGAAGAPAVAQGPVDLKAPITAIGDSVMLGARSSMQTLMPKVTVDAAVSRQSDTILDRIAARRASNLLDDAVVLHLGTNGPAPKEDLVKALEGLKDRKRVVLVTVHAPVRWMDESNSNIRAAAKEFPNVRIADWEANADGNWDYFVSDGTHLTTAGLKAYAETVAQALTAP